MKLIFFILVLGIIYKLMLISNGNFIFNMDNGRDMVEVREMVMLKNPRLIGPRTPIEGVFDGPAWYYLLAIPFIFSGGDPFASIVLEIILWAIGGFFLLKIVSRWSKFLVLPIGLIWIASDYIGLITQYAFNPNPITLLAPLFVFLLYKYLETEKMIYITATFFLAGLFFNFEMNFGIFLPLIILTSIILSKKTKFLKSRNFWIGSLSFLICLLPQVAFDIKNNFIMTNALVNFLLYPSDFAFSTVRHLDTISKKFFETFGATMMNHRTFSSLLILISIPVLMKFIAEKRKDYVVIISLALILIPFIIFVAISSISVNPWHLGVPMVSAIILVAFLLQRVSKLISVPLIIAILYFAFLNVSNFFISPRNVSLDHSLYRNEIAAIDFVYKYAGGKNFKVYTFLPSVYDYPYQYLFWWYGLKVYGYLPEDYAYLPGRPEYIPGKKSFSAKEEDLKKRQNSNLIFLIKEYDSNNTLSGWVGNFTDLESIEETLVGSLKIDIRKRVTF